MFYQSEALWWSLSTTQGLHMLGSVNLTELMCINKATVYAQAVSD